MQKVDKFMIKVQEICDPLIGLLFNLYVLSAQIAIFCLYPSSQMGLILTLVILETLILYVIILAINSKSFEDFSFCK